MTAKSKINWTYTLFFIMTPLVGIVGTVLLTVFGLVAWPTWVLAGGLVLATGLSITAGYHRLFAHGSYKAAWPVRLFFLIFGAASLQGSALEWCTDHVDHHRYVDTDKDPYNINRGFWFAHIGWIFRLDTSKRTFENVKELAQDPLVLFQHRYYHFIALFMGFVFPVLIASLWGNPIAGLIVAGALRLTFVHHGTFFINSICHLFGRQTYMKDQTARDNWLTALVTFGEGYHNFHHKFAKDYRNGVRFYHFDPTKWLIQGLSWLGLAYDLYRVNNRRILQCRIRTQADSWITQTECKAKEVYDQLLQAFTRLDQLEFKYKAFKQTRVEYFSGKMKDYKKELNRHRARVKVAKRNLNYTLTEWSDVLSDAMLSRKKVPVEV